MTDMIKIPYLGIEFHVDSFFNGETAQDNKKLVEEYGMSKEAEIMVLDMACNNFIPTWNKLAKKFGTHLYGLWDDCIEPQLREWFGFPPSGHINEKRRHIYFECRHHSIEVA